MKKSDVYPIFGSLNKTAEALGVTQQAVSNWPATLEQRHIDRLIGASLRVGKYKAMKRLVQANVNDQLSEG